MTLLTPLALLFGLFAAVPLILHLYQRRRKTVLEFSTNRFFTDSIIRAQRRLRLRRLMLLLLRVTACLALALALAQPIMTLTSGSGRGGSRDLVIILDDSLSMTIGEAGLTHFDKARQLGLAAIDQLVSGDRVALLTTTGSAPASNAGQPQLSDDLAAVRQTLLDLTPSAAGGDASAAMATAAKLLDGIDRRAGMTLLITDAQIGDFPPTRWAQPDHVTPVTVIAIASPAPQNIAVARPMLTQSVAVVGQPNAARLRLVNFGPATVTGRLRLLLNDESLLDHVVTLPGHSPYEELAPLILDEAGDHRLELRFDSASPLAGDLLADNVSYAVATATPRLSVLLVDGAAAMPASQRDSAEKSGAFYLQAALQAISDAEALQVDVVGPEQLAAARLDSYRVVMLCDVGPLAESQAQRLRGFVRQGGGLAIFLGSRSEPDFFNAALAELTPGVVGALVSPGAAEAQQAWHIVTADLEHSVLARFADELQSAVAGVSIMQARDVEPREAAVIAAMEGGRPLLLERGYGLGRVLLFATDMTPTSTNLPLRRVFLPLVGRTVSYLAGGSQQHAQPVVGRSLTVARGGGWDHSTPLNFLSPGGDAMAATWSMRGLEPIATLAAPTVVQAGFYELQRSGTTVPTGAPRLFGVNVPRLESDPARVDLQSLSQRGGRWKVTVVDAGGPGQTGETGQAREAVAALLDDAGVSRGIWDALLWAALALVLIEPLIANVLMRQRSDAGGKLASVSREAMLPRDHGAGGSGLSAAAMERTFPPRREVEVRA